MATVIELAGSPQWTDQPGNGQGTRKWLVSIEQIYTFSGRPTPGVSRLTDGIAWLSADSPAGRLICDAVSHELQGAGFQYGGVTYSAAMAIVTATYRERQALSDAGLLQIEGSARVVGVPPDELGISFNRICSLQRLRVTQYYSAQQSRSTILDALLNTVNASSWRGRPPGTVLFESYDLQQIWDASGSLIERVTYSLAYNPAGWNNVPDANGNWVPRVPQLYPAASWAGLGV